MTSLAAMPALAHQPSYHTFVTVLVIALAVVVWAFWPRKGNRR